MAGRGDVEAARAGWRKAVTLLSELAHPDLLTVRRKLDTLPVGTAAGDA